uniref:Uncharacterized protein n=1 Tax=Setaria italica TaxID=4555 RepID=K3XTH5_SETIT
MREHSNSLYTFPKKEAPLHEFTIYKKGMRSLLVLTTRKIRHFPP